MFVYDVVQLDDVCSGWMVCRLDDVGSRWMACRIGFSLAYALGEIVERCHIPFDELVGPCLSTGVTVKEVIEPLFLGVVVAVD